jgi:phosphoglycerol transferase MdoB-like AlkP superfamily enzyme
MMDGFVWDLGTWFVFSISFVLFSLFVPVKKHQVCLNSLWYKFTLFIFTFCVCFIAFSEMVFWNEFHSRFNFIAVDYLIYTHEVLANIRESFPMGQILIGIFTFSLGITFGILKLKFSSWNKNEFLKKETTFIILGILFPLIFVTSIGPWLENHDENFHDDQLARNGVFEFVRAFRSNQIDYKSFYKTISPEQANRFLNSTMIEATPAVIEIKGQRPNIMMIVVESLGAKFIGALSGRADTTPYLNKLTTESVFFENFYSTGNRTVRGLEALTLSIPPTPGYAVVKRPAHKGLFSLGHTFKNNGYDLSFLYGGHGFFDNMNSFFSNNEFSVIDQGDFSNAEISFSNAWGVCDEDLFKKAINTIEKSESKKPFFFFLLTTSNHRPFTYPGNKIDIPSGTSRTGAVKNTDYAIGKFLEEIKNKNWAKNTIFVIVADHSTEGRGQFDLEMNDFHIPLWIYSPHLLKPQIVSRLGSQIDLLPTLIHMLNLKDDSPFYGRSLLNPNWKEERAFVGNYQYVGYYKNSVLTTLGPNKIVRNYSYNPKTKKQDFIVDSPYVDEAVSYYQHASHQLDSGLYKYKK